MENRTSETDRERNTEDGRFPRVLFCTIKFYIHIMKFSDTNMRLKHFVHRKNIERFFRNEQKVIMITQPQSDYISIETVMIIMGSFPEGRPFSYAYVFFERSHLSGLGEHNL